MDGIVASSTRGVAGSTVVYDWGDRAASLPTPVSDWLSRHEADPEAM